MFAELLIESRQFKMELRCGWRKRDRPQQRDDAERWTPARLVSSRQSKESIREIGAKVERRGERGYGVLRPLQDVVSVAQVRVSFREARVKRDGALSGGHGGVRVAPARERD